jgi:hypothetical protein
MGTGTDDLNLSGQPPEVIERAIAVKRSHADRLARELHRRRHHLTDWRWLVTHRGRGLAVVAGVLVLVAGAAITTAALRARARRRPAARFARLRRALARMIDRPERVASTPTAAQKIAVAALGPLASAGVKLLLRRAANARPANAEQAG